jgi:prevent-host-death family protein
MQRYTLTDTRNRNSEVFEKAAIEPLVVTQRSQPSHVIMSANTYQRLLKRLEELEDMLLGQAAETTLEKLSPGRNRNIYVNSPAFGK